MSKSKNPEIGSANPEVSKLSEQHKLDIKKTLAISALLTFLASAGATIEADHVINPDIETATPNPHVSKIETSADIYDIVPGETKFKLPGGEITYTVTGPEQTTNRQIVEQPPTITETVIESKTSATEIQLMEWAQKFEIDPKAVEPRGPEAIQTAVDQVQQLQADGWTIERIAVKGYASDESDSRNGDNPGFGIEDEKNNKLADKRAETVEGLYKQQLEQNLGLTSATSIESLIVVEPGEEVHDAKLANQIDAMADSLGMSTVDLVMEFNRHPESLPTEAQELLDGLRQDRFVRIEISASKQIVIEQTADPIFTTVEIVRPGEKHEESIIVIPIIIPIFKRKRTSAPPPIPPEPIKRTYDLIPPKTIGVGFSGHQRVQDRIKQTGEYNFHKDYKNGKNPVKRGSTRKR